jgi:glycogen phosphorylase
MDKPTRRSHPTNHISPSVEVVGFDSLVELALDLRWSWNHAAEEVWQHLDPTMWEITHNPRVVLQSVARNQIEHLSTDPIFRKRVDDFIQTKRQAEQSTATRPAKNFTARVVAQYAGGAGPLEAIRILWQR